MSKGNACVLLKTIIALLFVLLRAEAEEQGIVLPDEISPALSNPAILDISMEERPAFYQELSEDENYSREFREYAGKRYRLSEIRQKMLEALQGVHTPKSAESAVEQLLAYDKEVAEMDTRQAFINAKRKANRVELYLLAHLYVWEEMECAMLHKMMKQCVKDKNLYQYEPLKRELNPRLHSRWNLAFDMPSFYVSTEPIIAAYKEIHEDSTRSAELREFAARCLRLNDIREKMLKAARMIHDETSAIEAGKTLTRYSDEIDALDMLRYYIEIKDNLSREEEKILDRLLLWRYDEATAFMSRYLRIWEEKGLDQYESKVEIIRKSGVLHTKYHPLWTDYMYRGGKPSIQLEKPVMDLILELDSFPYEKVLHPVRF